MASSASTSQALSAEIDTLFLQYLELLDQHDGLRKELGGLQASIQQNIARANFNAPRGVRYGEELYDGRMQAVRFCRITESGTAAVEGFQVGMKLEKGEHKVSESVKKAGAGEKVHADGNTETHNTKSNVLKEAKDKSHAELKADEKSTEDEDLEKDKKPKIKDPLRMFGILTPQALRVAQGKSINMVEEIIPRLVSVSAEMKAVEIKIRRARKHRTKAEAAEAAEATAKMDRLDVNGGVEV